MKKKALLAAFVATMLWSGSYVVNKIAFACGIGPFTLSGVRYGLAALLLFCVLPKGKNENALSLWQVILLASVCYVLGQGFQYLGQSRLTPTVASLVLNLGMILFIVLADFFKLKENKNASLLWWVGLLAIAILFFDEPWKVERASLSWLGIFSMLLAAFGSAMNIVFNRYFLKEKGVGQRQLMVKPMLLGGGMMLLIGVISEPLPTFSLPLLLCVAYLAGLSGALGFFLWTWSQKTLTSVQNGCINHLMLVEIAALDMLLFGRELDFWQWFGIGLTVVSLWGVVMTKEKRITQRKK